MTYECTVKGGTDGATVWRGSAFNCSGNDIGIVHDPDVSDSGSCNNGALVAQKLMATDGFYTSQLNVTISSDIIGRSVECAYSEEHTTSKIGTENITGMNQKGRVHAFIKGTCIRAHGHTQNFMII